MYIKYFKFVAVFIFIGIFTFISCEDKSVEPEPEITESSSEIIEPSSSSIFNNPEVIRISWITSLSFDKYELYYSNYNETVIGDWGPTNGNKKVYSSEWILLDENIDGQLREYDWENPYLYSDKVQIKLIGFLENKQYEILSDVFTVHIEEILYEERQYQEKLGVNNKWVYKISSYFVGESKNYYLVKDIINEFLEDGKNYYEIREKTIRDTISYKYLKVIDREHFSPAYILQNGDKFFLGLYSKLNGYWEMYQYHTNSVKVYNDEVFSTQMEIREYDLVDSGSGTFEQETKRAKDLGIFYEESNSDGHIVTKILQGALIDGVVYGDTTVIY